MKISIILFFSFLFFFSCKDESKLKPLEVNKEFNFMKKKVVKNFENKYGNIFGEIPIKIKDSTIISSWDIYQSQDGQIEFSKPDIWEIIKEKGFIIFCEFKEKEKGYFSFIGHNKLLNNITLDNYLDYVLKVVKEDSIELFIKSDKEISNIENQKKYFITFETKIGDTEYVSKCCYLEDNYNVYDLTIKYKKGNNDNLNNIYFDLVIHSIVINGEKLLGNLENKNRKFDIKFGIDTN